MIFAKDSHENLIKAQKSIEGFCPACQEKLTPKIGTIYCHHWAHKKNDCDSFSEPETPWHYNWKVTLGLENCEKVFRFPHHAIKDLQSFNLKRNATQKDLKKKYQELLYKWHPDRIKITNVKPDVAEMQTKRINAVYEKLIKNNFKESHRADVVLDDLVIELQNSPISEWEIFARENYYQNMIWLFNAHTIGKGLKLRNEEFKPNGSSYWTFRWLHPPKSIWACEKPILIDFGNKIFRIKKMYPNIPCGGWGFFVNPFQF